MSHYFVLFLLQTKRTAHILAIFSGSYFFKVPHVQFDIKSNAPGTSNHGQITPIRQYGFRGFCKWGTNQQVRARGLTHTPSEAQPRPLTAPCLR